MPDVEQEDQYIFDETVSQEREDYISDQLTAFNLAQSSAYAAGPSEPLPLHLYVLDRAGAVLAGLVGRTHAIPFWLEISVIWVDEKARLRGVGSQLMERAEREALERGCHYARLATSHYQAPAFYVKQGYRLYGTLENCPPGETVYYFRKKLDPAAR